MVSTFKHTGKLKKINLDVPFSSPDYHKEYNKLYRMVQKDDPDYIEKMKEYRKNYYNSLEKNDEYKKKRRETSQRYYLKHKEKIQLTNHINYIKKKNASGIEVIL